MKVTPYGLIAGISSLIALSIMNINLKLVVILIVSGIISTQICGYCDVTFNMVSFMGIFPIILLLFNNCKETYNTILALSLGAALSRIGCIFAGCCTGKETKSKLSMKYEGDYVVNKNTNKPIIRVTPTIFIEIFFQFLFIYIILKSKTPLVFFGFLNAALIIASDYWRLGGRAIDENIVTISSTTLILFSIISFFKCQKIAKSKINLKFNIYNLIFAVLVIIISSNNINVGYLN